MTDPEIVKIVRVRLLWLLCGLILSYVITLGVAIFLFDDAGFLNQIWGWPVMGVLIGAATIHIRFQFRKFDQVIRRAHSDSAASAEAAILADQSTEQPGAAAPGPSEADGSKAPNTETGGDPVAEEGGEKPK